MKQIIFNAPRFCVDFKVEDKEIHKIIQQWEKRGLLKIKNRTFLDLSKFYTLEIWEA